ncbi:hypothetical protein [Streptosporangium vulgare]|uniref:Uncharacterized protein n=1 Tax=Streptosporangium vulgare TaxID=46190 RepID=A0ABV5T7P6_9ACTN
MTAARPAIMRAAREGDHLDVDAAHHGVRGHVGQVPDAGHLADVADVIFWGLCPGCRSEDTRRREPPEEPL